MPDGIQTLDVPGLFQKAETVKASRLTNRVNEIRLQDAQRRAQREEQKRGIFQGAVGPEGQFDPQAAQRGLFQGGFTQEAIDFQKAQSEAKKIELEISQAGASLRGTQLDNAVKNADLIGRASLGLIQGVQNQAGQGKPRDQIIRDMQPLYDKVRQGLDSQGVDVSGFPDVFDIDLTAATLIASKSASDSLNAARKAQREALPKISQGTNEISLEIFDTTFNDANQAQRGIIKQVQQNRKKAVTAATGLEAQKAKEKLLVTGKSAEAAGKATGIKVALGNVGLLRDLILTKKGDIKRINVLKSKFGVGVGRMINFLTADTLSSRLRLESGAVISKEELDEMAKRFTVSLFPPDSKELVTLKMDKLEEFLGTADNFIDPSGIFNFAEFNRNFPTDLGKPIDIELPVGVPQGSTEIPNKTGPAGGRVFKTLDGRIFEAGE